MQKLKNDDPLIQVNWAKLKGYIVSVLKAVVVGGRKLGEFILKTILKILILLIRGFLATYKKLKSFAKSKQKGVWVLLLLFVIFSLLFIGRRVLEQKQRKYQELQFFHQQQLEETERLNKEKEEVQEELKETKEKLEAKLNRLTTVASARVTQVKPLSEEIKQIVAKHADAYGVSRKYCECIITLESGGCSEATGDNGRAHGVAQYHLGTYLSDAEKVGLPVQDDRRNPDRAILAMVGALSRGEDSKWTVSSSCN